VYLAPQGTALPFTVEDGYVKVDLPPAHTSAVVAIEYRE
jgi:hypothetical protein